MDVSTDETLIRKLKARLVHTELCPICIARWNPPLTGPTQALLSQTPPPPRETSDLNEGNSDVAADSESSSKENDSLPNNGAPVGGGDHDNTKCGSDAIPDAKTASAAASVRGGLDVFLATVLQDNRCKIDPSHKAVLRWVKWHDKVKPHEITMSGLGILGCSHRPCFAIAPKGVTDKEGRPFAFIFRARMDVHGSTGEDLVNMHAYVVEELVKRLVAPATSVVLISDYDGWSLGHNAYDGKSRRKLMRMLSVAYPGRIAMLIILKPPALLTAFVGVAHSFIAKGDTLKVLSHTRDLAEYIAPENLPKRYGGLDERVLPPDINDVAGSADGDLSNVNSGKDQPHHHGQHGCGEQGHDAHHHHHSSQRFRFASQHGHVLLNSKVSLDGITRKHAKKGTPDAAAADDAPPAAHTDDAKSGRQAFGRHPPVYSQHSGKARTKNSSAADLAHAVSSSGRSLFHLVHHRSHSHDNITRVRRSREEKTKKQHEHDAGSTSEHETSHSARRWHLPFAHKSSAKVAAPLTDHHSSSMRVNAERHLVRRQRHPAVVKSQALRDQSSAPTALALPLSDAAANSEHDGGGEHRQRELGGQQPAASTSGDGVLVWSVSDVCQWLESAGFGEFGTAISENDISGKELLKLTLQHLKDDIGIRSLGVRMRLIEARDKLTASGNTSARSSDDDDNDNESKTHRSSSATQDNNRHHRRHSHASRHTPVGASPSPSPSPSPQPSSDVIPSEKIRKGREHVGTDSPQGSKKSMSSSSKHHRRHRGSSSSSSSDEFHVSAKVASGVVGVRELTMSEINLAFGDVLGEGAYGSVYLGEWRGVKVAVKRLHTRSITGHVAEDAAASKRVDEALKTFKDEALLMQLLSNHPNIVPFVGAVCNRSEMALVTQYCAHGSLYDIFVKGHLMVPMRRLVSMLIDIAAGMWHLHRENVVHRDLACRNILVDTDWRVRVGDFGLSRLKNRRYKPQPNVGPLRWMSPEAIDGAVYSNKSDTFSFGVVAWELFTQDAPFHDLDNMSVALGVARNGLRLKFPGYAPPRLAELTDQTWATDPAERPDFEVIHRQLTKLLKQMDHEWHEVRDEHARSHPGATLLEPTLGEVAHAMKIPMPGLDDRPEDTSNSSSSAYQSSTSSQSSSSESVSGGDDGDEEETEDAYDVHTESGLERFSPDGDNNGNVNSDGDGDAADNGDEEKDTHRDSEETIDRYAVRLQDDEDSYCVPDL